MYTWNRMERKQKERKRLILCEEDPPWFKRAGLCFYLLLSDSNGRTYGHDFCQRIHVLIEHANTAVRYILANRRRIVRTVNAIVWLT